MQVGIRDSGTAKRQRFRVKSGLQQRLHVLQQTLERSPSGFANYREKMARVFSCYTSLVTLRL